MNRSRAAPTDTTRHPIMNEHSYKTIAFAAAALLLTPAPGHASDDAGAATFRQEARATRAPADSLYRVGRAALNAGRYREASRAFLEVVRADADFSHAADALYWRALSLYRLGDESDLRQALGALERLRAEYPDARIIGDASALDTRVRGMLARTGDAEAAAEIMESARVADGVDTDADMETDVDVYTENPEVDVQASADAGVRVAALNALLQMDSDRALPILENVIRDCPECSPDLRRRALFMVAQQAADSTATELLLHTARSDPDPEVRRQAVFWLSEVDSPRAVDALREVLASPADSALHERAAFALAQHEGPEAAAAIRSLARDRTASPELRARAIFWLGREEGNDGYLRDLFDEVSEPTLREKILFSVAEADAEGNRSWFIDVARDAANPKSIRKKALFWAGRAEGPLAPLVDLYDGLQGRDLKEQLLFAVVQSEAEGATEWLIEVARTEDDPELRKRAIFWLGQSEDPRAADALAEIIGSGGD